MTWRILHVLDHSLPLHSGYAFRTLAILREQRALGWETIALTTPKQGACADLVEHTGEWTFKRTPNTGREGLSAAMRLTARRLQQLVREVRPSVIHAHSPVLNALPSLWVGRREGVPVVYEMRASWEDAAVDHGDTVPGSPRYLASRLLESFALRQADQVTTICEGLRREIVARGVPDERVTVVPNAVDASAFRCRAPNAELRSRLGLDHATVLGFAGSFYGYEGIDLLLEAARLMLPRHPDLRVLLVGGGPQEGALKAQAAQAGWGDRVVFAGRVPQAQVHDYYDLVDVMAYPRRSMRLTEMVTPLKPLEAMAQGRLFVASDVGGHRELVQHGVTGFLCRAGDPAALAQALEQVLGTPDDWPRLRAQARRYVESERHWAGSVARYADVYGRAIDRSPRDGVVASAT
jgi:glycogen(starch) synthase